MSVWFGELNFKSNLEMFVMFIEVVFYDMEEDVKYLVEFCFWCVVFWVIVYGIVCYFVECDG